MDRICAGVWGIGPYGKSRTDAAVYRAQPDSPKAPAWLKEHQHADANLWWCQEQVEHFETRRDMCLAALKAKG
jgi:hypothetical protein